ncbi:MAG: transposase, partial [Chloroflexi bacterium]|nr:transposase [Chloroflexota bacterium]
DERGVTASGFLRRMEAHFRGLGVPVQRVLTDNGSPYVSAAWKASCADLGVGARRTRPYRPQTNGKVERWFQTVLRECLSLRPLASEDERQRALDAFVEYSNHDRPHLGINGLTPLVRLASLSTTL